jgi:hypothetical protein
MKIEVHRLNMELDLQSLFGLHVHSCTHWLSPAFGASLWSPGPLEAHPRALEAHPGAVEAPPGVMIKFLFEVTQNFVWKLHEFTRNLAFWAHLRGRYTGEPR